MQQTCIYVVASLDNANFLLRIGEYLGTWRSPRVQPLVLAWPGNVYLSGLAMMDAKHSANNQGQFDWTFEVSQMKFNVI